MTVYLDLDDVIDAARFAIAPDPVLVRDSGLIESAVARPQASAFGEDAYPDLWTKAAAFHESLARNHALVDGNKRFAWVAMRFFLIVNGEDVAAPSAEIGDIFVRDVAQGLMSVEQIAARLQEWRRR